jgi:hypothetical protein
MRSDEVTSDENMYPAVYLAETATCPVGAVLLVVAASCSIVVVAGVGAGVGANVGVGVGAGMGLGACVGGASVTITPPPQAQHISALVKSLSS